MTVTSPTQPVPTAPRGATPVLRFAPWGEAAKYDNSPDGSYSRSAWLPTLGPSSWVLWTTLADDLRKHPSPARVFWSPQELARAIGLGHKEDGRGTPPVIRAIDRLVRFGLLEYGGETPDHVTLYRVRLSVPTRTAATKPEGGHV